MLTDVRPMAHDPSSPPKFMVPETCAENLGRVPWALVRTAGACPVPGYCLSIVVIHCAAGRHCFIDGHIECLRATVGWCDCACIQT